MGNYLFLLATAQFDASQVRLRDLRQRCTIGMPPTNDSLWARLKRKLKPVKPASKRKGP